MPPVGDRGELRGGRRPGPSSGPQTSGKIEVNQPTVRDRSTSSNIGSRPCPSTASGTSSPPVQPRSARAAPRSGRVISGTVGAAGAASRLGCLRGRARPARCACADRLSVPGRSRGSAARSAGSCSSQKPGLLAASLRASPRARPVARPTPNEVVLARQRRRAARREPARTPARGPRGGCATTRRRPRGGGRRRAAAPSAGARREQPDPEERPGASARLACSRGRALERLAARLGRHRRAGRPRRRGASHRRVAALAPAAVAAPKRRCNVSWWATTARRARTSSRGSHARGTGIDVAWLKWWASASSLLEEPALDRRQLRRDRPPAPCSAATRRVLDTTAASSPHRLVLEHVAWSRRAARLGGAGDQLDRQDRVAAELEEVVVDADGVETEHVAPRSRRGAARVCGAQRLAGVVAVTGVRAAGRAATSTLPCGVSGMWSRTTMDEGTIGSGSWSCSHRRSSARARPAVAGGVGCSAGRRDRGWREALPPRRGRTS